MRRVFVYVDKSAANIQIYFKMTLFDALNFCRQPLQNLAELGYKPGDERYLPMYRDYLDIISRGNKKTYAVALLADKYAISERTVYSVVKRFSACCNNVTAL